MFDGPTESELRSAGIRMSDLASTIVQPWPENARAANLFGLFRSQWRVGVGGVIGWDFGPVLAYMASLRYPPRRIERLVGQLRIMESEALAVFSEKAESV